MKEECGIFGKYQFYNTDTINGEVINGLLNLQHRGQDSAGISYTSNISETNITTFKNTGLVKDVFKTYNQKLQCNICIGHTRYTTFTSKLTDDGVQPMTSNNDYGDFSIAHNGNIPNLKNSKFGKLYNYTTDTDFIRQYLKYTKASSIEDLLIQFMNTVPGVYSLLIMTDNHLYAMRDRFGVRPLSLAQSSSGYYISSETGAFPDNINIIGDVLPGQIVKVSNKIVHIYQHQHQHQSQPQYSHCIFEYIYFSRPDSISNNFHVEDIRQKLGKELAKSESYVFDKEKTIVVGSPNSGILCGKGYAAASGIPYKQILTKNTNYNRSFIMPDQVTRINECNNKFIITDEINLTDYNIIIADDSIVRGNTIKAMIDLFKKAGATQIHLRIASPPVKHPCFFGINIATYNELIANRLTQDEIVQVAGATSLRYLTIEQLKSVFGENGNKFCRACFDGEYNKELLDW